MKTLLIIGLICSIIGLLCGIGILFTAKNEQQIHIAIGLCLIGVNLLIAPSIFHLLRTQF